jgi:hypothetical protein
VWLSSLPGAAAVTLLLLLEPQRRRRGSALGAGCVPMAMTMRSETKQPPTGSQAASASAANGAG